MSPKRIDTGGAALPGRGALFLFDRALALDAVARERQRLQALLGDRLAAALAIAEPAFVDLLQRERHFFQEHPVAVAQLEEELAIVGGRGLVPQVLDGIVLGALAVQDVLAHLLHELAMLLLQLLAEVDQAVFSHFDLLAPPRSPHATARGRRASRAGYHGVLHKSIPRAAS